VRAPSRAERRDRARLRSLVAGWRHYGTHSPYCSPVCSVDVVAGLTQTRTAPHEPATLTKRWLGGLNLFSGDSRPTSVVRFVVTADPRQRSASQVRGTLPNQDPPSETPGALRAAWCCGHLGVGSAAAACAAWQVLTRQAAVISRLAALDSAGVTAVDEAAAQLRLSRRQIYVLLGRWCAGEGVVSCVLPGRSSGGRGAAGYLKRPPRRPQTRNWVDSFAYSVVLLVNVLSARRRQERAHQRRSRRRRYMRSHPPHVVAGFLLWLPSGHLEALTASPPRATRQGPCRGVP